LNPAKPVALTCAMLPANAPDSDGLGNLKEALAWVQKPAAKGVTVVCAGQVHAGDALQKATAINAIRSPHRRWGRTLRLCKCLAWRRCWRAAIGHAWSWCSTMQGLMVVWCAP